MPIVLGTPGAAVVGGGGGLRRSNDVYWMPWTGDKTQLVGNGFQSVNGRLVFKVLGHAVGPGSHGITVGVGYLAGGVLRFGIYSILPANGGG